MRRTVTKEVILRRSRTHTHKERKLGTNEDSNKGSDIKEAKDPYMYTQREETRYNEEDSNKGSEEGTDYKT